MLSEKDWNKMTMFALRKIKQYGPEKQTMKAAEELGELQQECFKALTNRRDDDHITEEVADVLIMLTQLRLMYDIPICEISEWIDRKVNR